MVSLTELKAELADVEMRLLQLGASATFHDLRLMEMSLMRISSILRKMTGSEDLDAALSKLQRLIMTIRVAQATIHAFQVAAGPIGWTFFAVGAIATGLSAVDTMTELASH